MATGIYSGIMPIQNMTLAQPKGGYNLFFNFQFGAIVPNPRPTEGQLFPRGTYTRQSA